MRLHNTFMALALLLPKENLIKLKQVLTLQPLRSFTKQITVKLAGSDLPATLTIKGEVLRAEAYSKLEKK